MTQNYFDVTSLITGITLHPSHMILFVCRYLTLFYMRAGFPEIPQNSQKLCFLYFCMSIKFIYTYSDKISRSCDQWMESYDSFLGMTY